MPKTPPAIYSWLFYFSFSWAYWKEVWYKSWVFHCECNNKYRPYLQGDTWKVGWSMFLRGKSSPEWEYEGRGEGRTEMNSTFLEATSKTCDRQPGQTWTSQTSYNPLVSVSCKIRGWLLWKRLHNLRLRNSTSIRQRPVVDMTQF